MSDATNETPNEDTGAPRASAKPAGLAAQRAALLAVVPWWVVLLEGVAVLVIGLLLVLRTEVTTVVLVRFFGWYWLVHGVFELTNLVWDRTQWGWRVVSGILGVLAGIYILSAPLVGAAIVLGVVTISIGINGAIIGAASIAKAMSGGGWAVGIFGALSMIIGLAIAFNFPRYMLALPWVWGVMAAVAGISSIVAAFGVKKLQAERV